MPYISVCITNLPQGLSGKIFRFGHIRRWDQCADYILYFKVSTDPGLLKMRYSRRFVAVVIQILIPFDDDDDDDDDDEEEEEEEEEEEDYDEDDDDD